MLSDWARRWWACPEFTGSGPSIWQADMICETGETDETGENVVVVVVEQIEFLTGLPGLTGLPPNFPCPSKNWISERYQTS